MNNNIKLQITIHRTSTTSRRSRERCANTVNNTQSDGLAATSQYNSAAPVIMSLYHLCATCIHYLRKRGRLTKVGMIVNSYLLRSHVDIPPKQFKTHRDSLI